MRARPDVRSTFKSALAATLCHSGLRGVLARVRRAQAGGRRVLILGYHRVVKDFERAQRRSPPGGLISQATFRRQLQAALGAGYEPVSLGEALEVLAGREQAPKDLLVVTFDDGYRDVHRHALPVLRELKVPATVYLATHYVGTRRYFLHDRLYHLLLRFRERWLLTPQAGVTPELANLVLPVCKGWKTPSAALDAFIASSPHATLHAAVELLERHLAGLGGLEPEGCEVMDWDEVRELARAGLELGAHTARHVVLTHEPEATVEREIAESKATLERELGRQARDFAYCNGWYSDLVIRVLERQGFRSAVTTEDLPNRVGQSPFTLKRKVLGENFSRGWLGAYSPAVTACQLDDAFATLGLQTPVLGQREQRAASPGAGKPRRQRSA